MWISVVFVFVASVAGYVIQPVRRTSALSSFIKPSQSKSILKSTVDQNRVDFLQTRKVSDVVIEAPSLNSRRITASIILDCPLDDAWSILTDYNRLAVHVPNLVKSYLVPNPANPNGIRLFQEGAQKIVGFDFRASLTMDMTEEIGDENSSRRQKFIHFKLVESGMFSAFEGTWSLKYHSRFRKFDEATQQYTYTYSTLLTYSVFVKPKGLVPVIALEWRIREDIPINLRAVKTAAEKLNASRKNNLLLVDTTATGVDTLSSSDMPPPLRLVSNTWAQDETLGMYITSVTSSPPEINETSIQSLELNKKQKENETVISKIFQSIRSDNKN